MVIEFREIDDGFHEIYFNGEKTGVEIVVTSKGHVVLDPIACEGAFDTSDLEQILSKMKELQSNSQNSPSDADLSCQDELGYTRDDEDWFFDDKDD